MAAQNAGPVSQELEEYTVMEIAKDSMDKRTPSDSFSTPEKGQVIDVARVPSNEDEYQPALSHEEQFPIDPDAELETHEFTIRAVLVGSCLGGIIAASNVYLGLKTGWTFGSNLFGSIFGFAILKSMSKSLPVWAGGGYFGPKENVCCQAAATAAGSLGLLFTSGFPAMYQLGLLSTPKEDFGKLVTFTLACAYYGMIFAIPLRKLYILKFKLAFPSAVAAAVTIRSFHAGQAAAMNAKKKTYCLLIAFTVSIIWKCVSEYAPGILWSWHYGWTLYRIGWEQAIKLENWGWVLEFTPAFIGCGLLTGVNASYSIFGGSILAWGIIGPIIASAGAAFGQPYFPDKYPGYINYGNMVLKDPVSAPSPRYWLIWPGIMLLLAGSFAEIFAQYKVFYATFIALITPLVRKFSPRRNLKYNEDDLIVEPCSPDQLVPTWMWAGGLVFAVIFTCLIMGLQFHQNVGVTILALIFAMIFSLIGAESCGRTNIAPVTEVGNASQLVIGGVTHGHGSIANQQTLNITAGLLSTGASEQTVYMLSDLKTAHLLRASPRVQFYAQCCGAIVSVFMSVAIYVLFSTAYPCINDLALADSCSFSIPDVAAFRAIAIAVTSSSLPVPHSSAYFSLAVLVYAFIQTFVKYRYIPQKYHGYVPNLVVIGIAFLLNTQVYSTAMAFGATVAFFWQRNYPASFGMYCYSVAAGGLAGEGLGGIVGAILQIANVAGSIKGTTIGCPGNVYCG